MTAESSRRGSHALYSAESRSEALRCQRAELPRGRTVVSSTAPYGVGGLGRHFAELVEGLRATGNLAGYLTPAPLPQDHAQGHVVGLRTLERIALIAPPVRFSPSWRVVLSNVFFDYEGARQLPAGHECLLVFNGHARRHSIRACRLGYQWTGLVSANSHCENLARQHTKAFAAYPIERPWGIAMEAHLRAEYDAADCIYVASEYVRQSFVEAGVPQDRLRRFPLTPHVRFRPAGRGAPAPSTFNVVYVGSISVHKGIGLLIDMMLRLPYKDLRLHLIGGWASNTMRRYIETACARDMRIVCAPGDPLPHLQTAGVCAHPTYEDGFAYAPAEALSCGVPIIVSEDTGMKELVRHPSQGVVVPTGDLDALTEAVRSAYEGSWPTPSNATTSGTPQGTPLRGLR